MTDNNKAPSLGNFLHNRFGGRLVVDEVYAGEGSYNLIIEGMPQDIPKSEINLSITQFYRQIGFTQNIDLSRPDEPTFYKGPTGCENVRCVALSDQRDLCGRVLISAVPLLSTNTN